MVVAVASFQALALTIGQPQTAIWIGRPLDIAVPVTLEDAENGRSLCLGADVVQGDTRLDDKQVTVSLEQGAGGSSPRVRVRSTVPVQEPVVQVRLQAGCDAPQTRRFTLLADLPSQPTLPSVTRAPAGVEEARRWAEEGLSNNRDPASFGEVSVRRAPSRRLVAPARQVAGDAQAGESRTAPARAVRRAPAPIPVPALRQPAAALAAAAGALQQTTASPAGGPATGRDTGSGRPRLQLEGFEPIPPREAALRTSTQLAPQPDDPARRAEAAALWRAIAAPPDEVQREAQRAQAMEASLAALRAQAAQNQQALLAVRTELAQARDNRWRNPLPYLLGALLLLALAGLIVLWRALQHARNDAWWAEGAQLGRRHARPAGEDRRGPVSRMLQEPLDDGDAHYPGTAPHSHQALADDDDNTAAAPDPLATPPARLVSAEELFDVQQQSDFFLSLGQHEQAIEVLRDHILGNPQTSALAYLDLLGILQSLGRRGDYDQVRQEFLRVFNADVPEFDRFMEADGRGLEHYPHALARIESRWPGRDTLVLIEELVFRRPGGQEEAFDLAAYRELLMLYAVAREVVDSNPGSAVAASAPVSGPAPAPAASPAPARSDAPDTVPPSIYASLEPGVHDQTVMGTDVPLPQLPRDESRRVQSGIDTDLAAFDRTAHATLRAPLDAPASEAKPNAAADSVDFNLFDPRTEAEIAPRRPPQT